MTDVIVKHSRIGLQRRKLRSDGWTKEMRAAFLDMLAVTCNISASAAAVGRSADSARQLKRRDGEFAKLWAEAFAAGSERLEEELIACVLGQASSGNNPDAVRCDPPNVQFDPKLAMDVLKLQASLHPNRRKAGAPAAQDDVDVALVERLEALATRLEAK